MRPGDSLLDTNALIAWMKDDPVLNQRFRGRDVGASAVSLGELYFGARKSRLRDDNLRRIDRLLRYVDAIELDLAIAQTYGDLKQQLRAAGKPIPDNDLWIAATALAYDLTLVTRDKHFDAAPGLRVEAW